jgi:hypothetical protein
MNSENVSSCTACTKEEVETKPQVDMIVFRDVCRDVLSVSNLDIQLNDAVAVS